MKSLLLIASFLSFFILTIQAQVPQQINYQAVARNAAGVYANQVVSIRFIIHDGTPTGTNVYEETQPATTNQFGLFTCAIGAGTQVGTNIFTSINWTTGNKFLEVGLDPAGGTNYASMGTTQLNAVPYALYAASGGNSYSAGTGLNINGTVFSAKDTAALWNANKLQGNLVDTLSPQINQVLLWNGSKWSPSSTGTGSGSNAATLIYTSDGF